MFSEIALEAQKHKEALDSIVDYLINCIVPDIISPPTRSPSSSNLQVSGSYYHYGDTLPLWQLNARKLHLASVISDRGEKMMDRCLWFLSRTRFSIGVSILSKEQAKDYASIGLLRYFGQDRYGRPCAILNLGKYNATAGKRCIEELREFLIFALEVGRRCVGAVNESLRPTGDLVNDHTDGKLGSQRTTHYASPSRKHSDVNGSHKSLLALDAGERRFPIEFRQPEVTRGDIMPLVAHMCVILDLEGVGMGNLNTVVK
ncbi:hypothetical protein HDU67_004370 [Dinochytrium kinnereticum]|nr:hypothetical protein HDU67_004370 [Dinochytrium kinnereticum]